MSLTIAREIICHRALFSPLFTLTVQQLAPVILVVENDILQLAFQNKLLSSIACNISQFGARVADKQNRAQHWTLRELFRNINKLFQIFRDLPPAFPSEAPMLFIYPPCSHKYLDAAQVVIDFPPLVNFKNKPDLGKLLYLTKQEQQIKEYVRSYFCVSFTIIFGFVFAVIFILSQALSMKAQKARGAGLTSLS